MGNLHKDFFFSGLLRSKSLYENVTASITTAEKEPLFKAEETKGSCRCEEGALPDEAISS
jgi:hypothetical protein